MLWIGAVALVTAGMTLMLVRSRKTARGSAPPGLHLMNQRVDGRKTPYGNYTSILSAQTVQHYVANGAPPLPWLLSGEERETMDALAKYFARAIPAPDKDGQVSVMDTLGHGGPQLELFVPVLSSRSPVAVLARSWNVTSQTLDPTLFFFGALNEPLRAIVSKLGFETGQDTAADGMTVFRAGRKFSRRRAS